MPRKPKHDSGTMEDHPLNIRLPAQHHDLLSRLVDLERADLIARTGRDPAITRADLIRWLILDHARARGLLPPLSPLTAPPPVAPAVQEPVHEAAVEPVDVEPAAPPPVAPAVQEPVHEAAVEPVVPPAGVHEGHEAPAAAAELVDVEPVVPEGPVEPAVPAVPKRREVDLETVRADLAAALDAKIVTPAALAAAIGVTTSTISHFKSGRRGMAADKLQKLAGYLRKKRK